jgi:hypothetical protein
MTDESVMHTAHVLIGLTAIALKCPGGTRLDEHAQSVMARLSERTVEAQQLNETLHEVLAWLSTRDVPSIEKYEQWRSALLPAAPAPRCGTLLTLAKREVEQFRAECTDLAFGIFAVSGREHEAYVYFTRLGLSELASAQENLTVSSAAQLDQLRQLRVGLLELFKDPQPEDQGEALFQLVGQFTYRMEALGLVRSSASQSLKP